jgi:hypothetical protein
MFIDGREDGDVMPRRQADIHREGADRLSSPERIFQIIRIGMQDSESASRFHVYGQAFLKQPGGRLVIDETVSL